ncbi:hypothetical protein CABS01_10829 [Colletotrichum abscissum]|uniref:uncharacterized protein n=1 Tax=Colletotrichum abscissum TaxID=1671311 RepID=UPI0027D62AF7|nr:uncharacterized protein CABS01_10829 [Colletotrichum abscissum]KAK1497851.1 hypothetical protein CABS01_10829 [Colletotrichum abscissum]
MVKEPSFDIPVIFFPVCRSADKKLPTIVLGNGYDGSIEEMHHQYGAGILERGWNVLCYDGPGQICARRYQGIGFTHEWETVVSPVLDFLETAPIVNMNIDGLYNLMGIPVFDAEKGLARYSGVQDFAAAEKVFTDPGVLTTARWPLSHGLWAFKVRTPAEYLDKASYFSLKGIADKIQCPVFCC